MRKSNFALRLRPSGRRHTALDFMGHGQQQFRERRPINVNAPCVIEGDDHRRRVSRFGDNGRLAASRSVDDRAEHCLGLSKSHPSKGMLSREQTSEEEAFDLEIDPHWSRKRRGWWFVRQTAPSLLIYAQAKVAG
jgi:hypothetical protein